MPPTILAFPPRSRRLTFAALQAVRILNRPISPAQCVTADLAQVVGLAADGRNGPRFRLLTCTGTRRVVSAFQLLHVGGCDCAGPLTPAILVAGQVTCPHCRATSIAPIPPALWPEPSDPVTRWYALALRHGYSSGCCWSDALEHARRIVPPSVCVVAA